MAQNEASIEEKFFLIRCGTVSQKGGIYMKAKKLVAVEIGRASCRERVSSPV